VPGAANERARACRARANALRAKIVPGGEVEKTIEEGLRKYWSPEQISGRYKLEHGEPFVCAVTIYAYIVVHRKDLILFLRQGKNRRHRRKHGTKQREIRREEEKKKRIDVRPEVVEERSRIGDWEGDTIVGQEKTSHVLTHVERASGYLFGDKTDGLAATVRRATERRFRRCPKKKRLTVTYDNGIQFAEHEELEHNLEIDVYFAFPYHSWERGTNENTNGLLRQFLPKGTYFKSLTQRQLDRFVRLINTRPRKRLGYRTPEEVFNCVSD
jgi:IS30 family transposase